MEPIEYSKVDGDFELELEATNQSTLNSIGFVQYKDINQQESDDPSDDWINGGL